jgi:large subunit ribosomal protein L25
VIVHAIQVDVLTRRPIHLDLFAVRMTEELTVEVQLVGTGVAPATESGGTLVHPVQSVKVRALPDNLPETLTYDLSALTDYDATITVANIVVPEGVSIQADESEVIARVLAPRVEDAAVTADEGAAPAPAATDEAAEG